MKTYSAIFYGKARGAIGIFVRYNTVVQGTDPENAKLNLYERYDHIHRLTLEEII